MKKIAITEEQGIHKEWMARAKKIQNSQELKDFIDELNKKYSHDYGTICHFIAAAAVGAANAVQHGPQGGITGFQAGCIMWSIIDGWGVWGSGPKQVIEWENLLYPQYDYKMPRSVTRRTFDHLQKKAKEGLNREQDRKGTMSAKVLERWTLVAEGRLPPGMEVREE